MKTLPRLTGGLLLSAILASFVTAEISSTDLARLGRDLTPLGAEKAGNADGSIPAWTGGITTPPAGFQPGDHHPDPFAGDQPLAHIHVKIADTLAVVWQGCEMQAQVIR